MYCSTNRAQCCDCIDIVMLYIYSSAVPQFWGEIHTCCEITSVTDDVPDAHVKTPIKATRIDLLGESDLFIEPWFSSMDICQGILFWNVNTAQQLDTADGDFCQRAACF